MNKILMATKNKGKIAEFQKLLADLPIEVVSLDQVDNSIVEPEETGATFEENAVLKATYYANATNLPCIADDSGLEVDALDKRPGVYSARYAPGSDSDRNEKILAELGENPNRTARFVSICSFVEPGKEPVSFRGTVEGTIAEAQAGSAGFGYDPIFIPNGYTKTMAELGVEVKNTISHRAKALGQFVQWLAQQTL